MRPQLPEGYRVKYRHWRYLRGGLMVVSDQQARQFGLSPKGGETEAKVYGPDDSVVATGTATCHPRDNFNKQIARDIALGRALKQLARQGPYQIDGPTGPVQLRQGSTWDTHDQNSPVVEPEVSGA